MQNQMILPGMIKQFQYYKQLGDQTFQQVDASKIHWQYNDDSNSLAVLINHISGNMLSRFTNFFHEDGEKSWRNRDVEFEISEEDKDSLLKRWEQGWLCLFNVLENMSENDLDSIVYIRNVGHSAFEAINRQLAHYAYHVGQIVFIGKMIQGQKWKSLSIPRGGSDTFNKKHFEQPKSRKHFTDDYLNKDKE